MTRITRHPVATISLVVVALATPYYLAGVHFLADDFVWLRNAHFDGWWQAGGLRTAGRPGGWLTAALTFGAIGAHPAVLYGLMTGLRVLAAVCVYRCLAEFVRRNVALAVVLVWILTPNHLTLEIWLSTIAAPIALALLAEGVTRLARAWRADDTRTIVIAYLMLAGAVAVYELTAGVALLAVVVVPYMVGRSPDWRRGVLGLVVVTIPAGWAYLRSSVYGRGVATGHLDPSVVLPGHLSMGLAPFGAQGRLLTVMALAAIVWALVRAVRMGAGRAELGERLVLAGTVVLFFGVAPLASFDTNFFGMPDRLTLVSGVGAAMVWTGGALVVARYVRRPQPVLVAVTVMFLVVVVPVRFVRTSDYEDAGRRAHAEIAALSAQGRSTPVFDVPGPVADVGRSWGLNDGWNATAAVQVALDDPRVTIGTMIYGERVGPPLGTRNPEF